MRHGSEWYKRDPHAYLGGVQGMSAKEHAVFGIVLDLIYAHGGSVNNDPRWIAGWISDMGAASVRTTIASLVEAGKLEIDGDQITQKRAKNEAKTKENLKETAQKNGKKGGEKSAEIRAASKKNNDLPEPEASNEKQAEKIREDKSNGGGGDAHARECEPREIDTFRERILAACGADPVSGLTGHGGAQLGTKAQMIEVDRWASDLGLSEPEIIDAVERIMARKRDGPPKSLSYFTPSMQRLAAEIAEARTKQMEPQALRPVEGVQTSDQRNQHAPRFSHSGRGGSGNSLASIAARRRLEGQV